MSTTTVSRLPSRLPAKSGSGINDISTGQQKSLTMPSKLPKGLVKTNLKPPSAGINNVPTIPPSTTQLPSPPTTTTSNTQIASAAATNVDQTMRSKLRPPLKTNVDTTSSKTSPVSSLPKSASMTHSSNTNDLTPTKKNLVTQTAKPTRQASLLKRKNDDDAQTQTGRNVRVAPHNRKSSVKPPKKSISKNTSQNKEAKAVQQSRIARKNSTNSIKNHTAEIDELRTENTQLCAQVKKLRTENKKLQVEKKELMQEKGLLTADVCQMEHRLACEESRVIELEEDVADLRKQCSLLNGEHNKLDRDRDRYRRELEIANNLVMEQATTMSDQQSLIEELIAQLDEQELICQNLQNAIDTFKMNHNIFDDIQGILNLPSTSLNDNQTIQYTNHFTMGGGIKAN